MADVISVESLTKRYDELTAVDDISFSVQEGEIFGILGPNGAGKTTTLECVEGLVEPTAGSISVLGMDIASNAEAIKRRIGIQLQASAYFDYLTLREILDLFAMIYDCRVSADELLATVDLQSRADTTVARLSGGQQQRFAIAATLVNNPELVFLDEPTSGLDPQARRSLWQLVKTMNENGRTVVVTTHYMEEAEFLCDRVAIMDQGQIVALDTPGALVRSLPTPYQITVGLEGCEGVDSGLLRNDGGPDRADSLSSLANVTEVAEGPDESVVLHSTDSAATIRALMGWLSETGFVLTQLEVNTRSLEDVFLTLTGHGLQD